MKLYKIPVVWSMSDTLTIEADTLEEATQKAYDTPLTAGHYLEDSFEIDYDHSNYGQEEEL